MAGIDIILGIERRRRWSEAATLEILAEAEYSVHSRHRHHSSL